MNRQTLRHPELVSGSHNRSIKKRSSIKIYLWHEMIKECETRTKQGKNAAFTLAEILIVITIIGVVAAITIPPLINNIQDAQYKTAYKKAYSILNQALTNAISDNALENAPDRYAPEHWRNFATIMSYIKTQKTCLNYNASGHVTGGNAECWESGAEGWNMAANGGLGYPSSTDMAVIDASGMNWSLAARGYATLYMVDTNGFNKPNQMGKDRFLFILYDVNGKNISGIPIKVLPQGDNANNVCDFNKCGKVGDKDYKTYFGTSWLYK